MDASDQAKKTEKVLRVFLATPFGFRGRGGIDRLTDLMVESIQERGSFGIDPVRLVTRGQESLFQAGFVFAGALAKLWAAARRGNVDLIHINLASRGSAYRKLVLAALARLLRIPYVVHLHSGRFDQFWRTAGPRLAGAIDYFFENASAIIVLGEYWANVVCDRVPSARGKTVVLANATLPSPGDCAPSSDGRIRITFLGKIGPNKGTRQLIEALAILKDRRDWTATICGNGDVEESRNLAERLGIANRTLFPGWLDARATAEQLRQTDIFVLPSFSEGLPMSILEAFAWGIAVVATPVGSIPEVIKHEHNGLIVPVGTSLRWRWRYSGWLQTAISAGGWATPPGEITPSALTSMSTCRVSSPSGALRRRPGRRPSRRTAVVKLFRRRTRRAWERRIAEA
jgi:glycosyltransferase involved in cell wall biosynthesis